MSPYFMNTVTNAIENVMSNCGKFLYIKKYLGFRNVLKNIVANKIFEHFAMCSGYCYG